MLFLHDCFLDPARSVLLGLTLYLYSHIKDSDLTTQKYALLQDWKSRYGVRLSCGLW